MSATEPRLVLVVEDDPSVRQLLRTVLTEAGYLVETAGDGLEGLLKLRRHPPAVLVLDISMPDVGGLRVLDELAQEHSSIPVVVVTGKPQAAAAARERLGDDNVLTKPFDPQQLLARVDQLTTARHGGRP